MARRKHDVHTLALAHPLVDESIACAGTAIEQNVYRVGKKSFLFAQRKEQLQILRLKLGASLEEAERLASQLPKAIEVGKTGWVTLRIEANTALPPGLLKRWIAESYALSAPAKKKSAAKKTAKKVTTKKATKKKAGTKKAATKKAATKKAGK